MILAETIASLAVRIGADLSGFEKDMKEFKKSFGRIGQQVQDAGTKIGTAFTAAGGAIATGLGFAVAKSADFDAQMSRVGAISQATDSDLQALRKSALDLGASTSKSAAEVAQGMELMAAKGYDAQQIIAAMPGVIAAAEASGEDMAMVADTVASALNAFGLKASEASRVADVLAMSANTSAAGIQDLQFAFKYAAPLAKQLGIGMEELAAATGIMADAGMKGEQAGTTLRAALIRLSDPPREAKAALDELGISVTDSSGKFKPFGTIIGDFNQKLQGMSDAQKVAALSQIFGTEAATGMLSVVSAGPQKFSELTTALKNSSGASQDAASKMKDNLKGSLEELSGAAETAQISIGNALAPAIRALAEGLQSLINWFNNLSPATQKFIAIGAAITAVLFLVAGAVAFLAVGLGALAAAEWAVILPVAGIIAAVTAIIAIIVALGVLIYTHWDEIKAYLAAAWNWIKDTAATIWNGITTFFTAVWEKIKAVFFAVWSVIGPFITTVWENIKTIFFAALDTIKAYLSAGWEMIKTIFATAFLFIVYLVTGQWDKIGALFSAAWEKINGIVLGLWENIKSIWSTAFDAVYQRTVSMWNSVVDFFKNAPGRIISTLMDLRSRMLAKFEEMKSDALNMGKNIIQGLINGVASMANALVDKVKGVVDDAIKSAKNLLGIHSPSRVFMEIGGYTSEGFAIGIEDNAKQAIQAINSLANSTITAAMGLTPVPISSTEQMPGTNVTNYVSVNAGSVDMDEQRLIRLLRHVEVLGGYV